MTKDNATAEDGTRAGGALQGARGTASKAYDRTVEAASGAYDATKTGTGDVLKRTGNAIDVAPLSVIAGGVAIGALAGLVLPRTARETDLLGATGKRLNAAATAAVKTARDVGMDELAARGISRDAARKQASQLFDGLVQAASSTGEAATQAAIKKAKPDKAS